MFIPIFLLLIPIIRHVHTQPTEDLTAKYDDEDSHQLRLHLMHLDLIRKRVVPKFEENLRKVTDSTISLLKTDPKLREELRWQIDEFLATSEEFTDYLMQELDTIFIDLEIHTEIYYLTELKSHHDAAAVASEVAAVLEKYASLLSERNVDKKYDDFATVRELYSDELNLIVEGQPETELSLNVQLKYMLEFIEELQKSVKEFQRELAELKSRVEKAVQSSDLEEKHKVLNCFDDTKFGKFLFWKNEEFLVQKFGN